MLNKGINYFPKNFWIVLNECVTDCPLHHVMCVSVWWSWPRTSCGSWWIWCFGWSVTGNWVWRGSCERTSSIKWNRRGSCGTCTRSSLSPRGASLPGKGQSSGVIRYISSLHVCFVFNWLFLRRPGTLHDFRSHEIADQLTLLDAELFYKIEVTNTDGFIWCDDGFISFLISGCKNVKSDAQ